MSRTIEEWIGRTDDSVPPASCKQRIVDRQGRKCAITGQRFGPKDKIEFDHVVPLWLGGKNSEANLQAVKSVPHAAKTKTEASVRAKVNANAQKHLGLRPKSKSFQKPDGLKFNWKSKRYERAARSAPEKSHHDTD